jgi:hypothetical protein
MAGAKAALHPTTSDPTPLLKYLTRLANSHSRPYLLHVSKKSYLRLDMRYIVLSLIGAALVYGQCNQCTPDPAQSPRPFGFNPSVLRLPPAKDTSLTIYFTFPDQVQQGSLTVYPNYAIWVDSLRLDQGLITTRAAALLRIMLLILQQVPSILIRCIATSSGGVGRRTMLTLSFIRIQARRQARRGRRHPSDAPVSAFAPPLMRVAIRYG